MDGSSRKPTLLVQRAHVPNRLSEQALLGVYERLLQVLARQEGEKKHIPEPTLPEPFLVNTTGGPS
jgi:hypothetical protein